MFIVALAVLCCIQGNALVKNSTKTLGTVDVFNRPTTTVTTALDISSVQRIALSLDVSFVSNLTRSCFLFLEKVRFQSGIIKINDAIDTKGINQK
ncbi:MAG: hypothetical protein DRP42_02425 [Tenericutes bacterium]|nr:MAG: hypothetical protein DRP42_02425 [Mycoplasmatota bacterium]